MEIIDGEAEMIDIDKLERRLKSCEIYGSLITVDRAEILALIADLRRLRERLKFRQCPCGGDPKLRFTHGGNFFISCLDCGCRARISNTAAEAWAAWDGIVEETKK